MDNINLEKQENSLPEEAEVSEQPDIEETENVSEQTEADYE